jgi:hypothetical protein
MAVNWSGWCVTLIGVALTGCGSTPAPTGTTSGGNSGNGASTTTGTATSSASSSGTTTSGSSTTGSRTSSGTSSGSGTTTGTSTSSGTTTGAFQIAPHNPLPQVPNNGIPVLAAPEVVTVSYAGYAYDVKGYFDQLVESSWLTAVGADYGVGPGQVTGSLILDGGPNGGPVSVTDLDITLLLTALIYDGGVPAPTPNSIYIVVFPESTVITSNGGTSCYSFGGYHSYFMLDAGAVVYGAIPTCQSPVGSVTTSEGLLAEALSHEFIEAATDPTPAPPLAGYAFIDFANPYTYTYGEVGDLCAYTPLYQTTDGGFTAQRIWSNSAAHLGTSSPCIPAPADEIYFAVSVDPDATVVVDAGAEDQTLAFTVTGWSTAAMPDWAAWAQPAPVGDINPVLLNPLLNGSNYPMNINNGQTATLTITVPGGTPSGSYAGIILYSYVTPNQIDYFGSYAAAAVYVQ